MIVCHRYKYIFIKTRKTASTSLEIALSQWCGRTDIISALSNKDEKIRKKLRYRGAQNFFAPVSSYSFREWRKLLSSGQRKLLSGQHSPAAFVKELVGDNIWETYFKFTFERNPFDRAISRYYWKTRELTALPEINEYIQGNNQKQLSNWDKYTENDQITVDFVGRYETLLDDLAKIKETIGLPGLNLLHTKGHARRDYRHYSQILNGKTRAHIEEACKNEIEAFQYHWVDG